MAKPFKTNTTLGLLCLALIFIQPEASFASKARGKICNEINGVFDREKELASLTQEKKIRTDIVAQKVQIKKLESEISYLTETSASNDILIERFSQLNKILGLAVENSVVLQNLKEALEQASHASSESDLETSLTILNEVSIQVEQIDEALYVDILHVLAELEMGGAKWVSYSSMLTQLQMVSALDVAEAKLLIQNNIDSGRFLEQQKITNEILVQEKKHQIRQIESTNPELFSQSHKQLEDRVTAMNQPIAHKLGQIEDAKEKASECFDADVREQRTVPHRGIMY